MKQTIEDRIISMLNKVWMYNASNHKLLQYRIKGDMVTLVTDKTFIEVPLKELNKKLDEFLPVESDEEKALVLIIKNKESLVNIIQENINKIQNNPEFIPQAKEINSQIKTLIDMVKTEIMIRKIAK